MSERDLPILVVLSGVFGGAIVFANVAAGVKAIEIFGLIVPAGTIAYSLTFPITDIVDEVYGKRVAYYIVWAGLAAEAGLLAMVTVDYLLPPLEQAQQELYERVFSPQYRIVAASVVAYVVSQHHDVWAFWAWRQLTRGRYLWLRNNASTSVSQLIDSAVFMVIAFYGVWETRDLVIGILSLWAFKLMIAAADTPLVYLGVWLVNRLRLGAVMVHEAGKEAGLRGHVRL